MPVLLYFSLLVQVISASVDGSVRLWYRRTGHFLGCLSVCLSMSNRHCLSVYIRPSILSFPSLSFRPGDIGFGGRFCPSLVPPDRSLPRLFRPIFRLFPAQNPATHEDPHLRRTARPAQRHSRSIFSRDGDVHITRDVEVLLELKCVLRR